MKLIKTLSLLLFITVVISGCGMLNPAAQVENFKNYKYDVQSVTDFKIAGKSAESLIGKGNTALTSLPGLAFAIIRKDLPLEAKVNMRVSNPTGKVANIGSFKYLIEIQGKPLVEGEVNEDVRLENGSSATIPFRFGANLFGVNKDEKGIDKLLGDILTREGNGFIVLKIKPSVKIGGKSVYYPGYITVDNDLLKSVSGLLK
ncbi:hypothetical protein [Chitinophaga rhizophila]|uniref:Late embryogenesis abundant protein n=1 Tax=Chitinophaga rhizophila TaxID=2866212 RepID=A0ABS7GI45_9BACT|nr:hypothetical protein [Chitinophaga rhizophila]MBW8687370.1 hypothetical protein [Chitinophaga rhizophila]